MTRSSRVQFPGAILSDGKLYMVVDQRAGATGSGSCPDLPMP